MKIEFLEEPELEFGVGRHVDIKFGLMNYGPADYASSFAPKNIKIGLVGTTQTVEGLCTWFERCRAEIPAKPSSLPHLFPKFPGFNADNGFRSELVFDSQLQRTIPQREFVRLQTKKNSNDVVAQAVTLFLSEIEYLAENPNIDVLLCAPPMELLEAMAREEFAYKEEDEDPEAAALDFHDMLKAKAMHLSKPMQIVLPMTYDNTKRLKQKLHSDRVRQLQDEATRAWNIHTALYYKAGGTPWRLIRDPSELTVCHVGISFYKTLDGKSLMTSMAQVFNERGDGVIVRGGVVRVSKEDRQPHLNADDAQSLLDSALKTYRLEHKTLPARIVLHKTSTYNDDEIEGFSAATDKHQIEMAEFVSLTKSGPKLFRAGAYPALRGTLLNLDEKTHILYTRGSVDFFSTYPGMYVPTPLKIRCESVEQTPRFIASEMLALSKMNWNNTQFDGGQPITIRASHKVGHILRYVEENDRVQSRFSYYM